MKTIELTKNKIALIDDDDYNLISSHKWYFGAGYAKRGHSIYMHRIIANCPSNMEVDHINGDNLDNRKDNLRICTGQQNRFNTRARRNGYKGVRFHKGAWEAKIKLNEKCYYLGSFSNETEAAIAYDNAAKKYFGDFAKLNFPDSEGAK